jgi:kynureninase
MVDGYQAAGTLPVDVVALDVDLYVGGSVKYLCGGPGNGWMYAAPHVSAQLEPVTTGWFGQASPFAFDPENAYADGHRPLRRAARRASRRLRRGAGLPGARRDRRDPGARALACR